MAGCDPRPTRALFADDTPDNAPSGVRPLIPGRQWFRVDADTLHTPGLTRDGAAVGLLWALTACKRQGDGAFAAPARGDVAQALGVRGAIRRAFELAPVRGGWPDAFAGVEPAAWDALAAAIGDAAWAALIDSGAVVPAVAADLPLELAGQPAPPGGWWTVPGWADVNPPADKRRAGRERPPADAPADDPRRAAAAWADARDGLLAAVERFAPGVSRKPLAGYIGSLKGQGATPADLAAAARRVSFTVDVWTDEDGAAYRALQRGSLDAAKRLIRDTLGTALDGRGPAR